MEDSGLKDEMEEEEEGEEECYICQDEMGQRVALKCGHEFHPSCIVSWFQTGKSSCPTCRHDPGREEENRSVWSVQEAPSNLERRRFLLVQRRAGRNYARRKTCEREYARINSLLFERKKKVREERRVIHLEWKQFLEKEGEVWRKGVSLRKKWRSASIRSMSIERKYQRNQELKGMTIDKGFYVVGVNGPRFTFYELEEAVNRGEVGDTSLVSHTCLSSAYRADVLLSRLSWATRALFTTRRIRP
jgi:hypothetical protein